MTDYSVYLVADTGVTRSAAERGVHSLTLPQVVDQAVAAGVRAVQIRAKDLTPAEAEELVRSVAPFTEGRACLLLNDFVETAVRLRREGVPLDGVHMGQSDGSPRDAREALGPDALIGLTCDAPSHLEALRALPRGTVSAIGVGTVRSTTSKANAPSPKGFDGLARFLSLAADLPVDTVAIGGLGLGDAARVRAAGAGGMAVVSAICAAPSPAEAAAALRADWDASA